MNDALQILAQALGDRYRVERELEEGGTAVVYLARDLKHDRRVALKVLKSELAASLGSDLFLKEIQITAQLQHPHILPLHDSGAAGGLLYYVMPYVEGESLRDRLNREKQLPVKDALHIVREVADGLSYAHQRGVVHRDIKPENIMLSGGHAVITDFGIAQAIQLAGERTVLVNETVSGTPAYMSPEQASGGQVDARSDIYSLACVLYEMLVGKPPFQDVTAQGLMRKILADPPPSISSQRDTVTASLERTVLQGLAKLPADRPSTIGEFIDALRAETDTGRMATVRIAAEAAPAPAEPGTRPPLGPGPAILLFLVSAAAILGITVLLVRVAGLPDWVLPGAAVLLLVGLPITVITAVVQARQHTDTAMAQAVAGRPRRHWLTWRKALTGGVIALAVWGLVVAGYMVSRKAGIGPAASLVSAGVLDEKSRVLIAEFENKTEDAFLGEALREALNVDLAQSTAIQVVSPDGVAAILKRMERAPDTVMDLDTAREVARRDGIKAVVAGQVYPTGSSFVLSARLVAPESGDVLTAQRETARNDGELIEAVDRLSKGLREKIGESLKTIRAEKPLAEVTTGSMEALRKYSMAVQAEDYEDDSMKAIGLLEEAAALDTTFAMAYRKLGVILGNVNLNRAKQLRALSLAYEYRDRLTPRERYLAIGSYHTAFNEPEEAIRAYENLLDLDPDDTYPLNNLGVIYQTLGDYEKALEYAQRAQSIEKGGNHYGNIIASLIGLGRFDEANAVMEEYRQFSSGPQTSIFVSWALVAERDYDAALAEIDKVAEAAVASPFLARASHFLTGRILSIHGRLNEADKRFRSATDANLAMGNYGGALGQALDPAWEDVLLRGRTDRVEEMVAAALQDAPWDSIEIEGRPYLGLAELYAVAGNPKRSRALIDAYRTEVDPRVVRAAADDVQHAMGMVALAEGDFGEAVKELFSAKERGHRLFDPMLARAYDAAGEPDSALAEYLRFIETPVIYRVFADPMLAPGLLRVAQIYDDKGDVVRAVNYYSRFVELWKDADPDLQPRVKEAQARINALMAESPKS
jgi:tetratricopeptide (TPR) repeat protein